jgi:NADH-quinone oxidoreductase subunit N
MSKELLLESLKLFAPEAALTGLILLVVLADLCFRRKAVAGWLALAGTLALLAWSVCLLVTVDPARGLVVRDIAGRADAFGGSATSDAYALFFRALFLAATAVVIAFAMPVASKWASGHGEVYALMLSCTLGMCFMAAASDLLMMYLSLEFVSVTSYVLAGFLRRNRKSAEASLKYILYGAAASGMMVYGMTFLYGLTGTLQIEAVGQKMAGLDGLPPTMTLVVSVLVMAGFGYKIAAVPFHMWCPDVYEGAPTPVTAYFSVGPMAAGFAMLARFLSGVIQTGTAADPSFNWRMIIALLAVVTLAVGNLAALRQQNLKRLMAYSSIGHAGFMLLAFVVFRVESLQSVMFYVVAYLVMNLGAFLVVIVLEENFGVETVEQCRGLGWREPAMGTLMVVFLLSLTGLPPTAGFVAKLLVVAFLVKDGLAGGPMRNVELGLAVVGVLFSVVALFYYARIFAAMFLVRPREVGGVERVPLTSSILLWGLAGATLLLGVMPGKLMEISLDCAKRMLPAVAP